MDKDLVTNSDKIKIMHIIRQADGGMKEHLYSLLKYLQKDDFELVVACPPDSSVAKKLSDLDVKIVEVDILDSLDPKKDLLAIRQLITHLTQEKPKIIHTHGAKAGYLGRIAGVITRVPKIVATVHGFTLENDINPWKKRAFRVSERLLARYTDNIITVSGAIKRNLMESCNIKESKIRTIYNGVDCEKSLAEKINFELAEELNILKDKEKPLVGVVARLAPQKGVRYFIEAAKKVIEKFPKARFIVVGEGPERIYLENLKIRLNLDQSLCFLGERKDVNKILKILDVFVLPSVSEGLSITALEAMAASCPIVATKTGGIPEIIKDKYNGIIVEPQDSQALAEGICNLLENKDFATELAANGNSLVQKEYSLVKMVNSTKSLYLDLLKVN